MGDNLKWKDLSDNVKPFRKYIRDHGGNDPEVLLARLDNEMNLSLTNIFVFTLAVQVDAQVRLIERLLASGLLKINE